MDASCAKVLGPCRVNRSALDMNDSAISASSAFASQVEICSSTSDLFVTCPLRLLGTGAYGDKPPARFPREGAPLGSGLEVDFDLPPACFLVEGAPLYSGLGAAFGAELLPLVLEGLLDLGLAAAQAALGGTEASSR